MELRNKKCQDIIRLIVVKDHYQGKGNKESSKDAHMQPNTSPDKKYFDSEDNSMRGKIVF